MRASAWRGHLVVGLLLLLSGCAGGVVNMDEQPGTTAVAPSPGKAMVVFLRPSGLGALIQSTVYEVDGDTMEIIGVVAAKTKVAYQAQPGRRLFMVVGETAEFMSAELQAAKTYYAYVSPRMGMWKARFVFEPVGQAKLDGDEFRRDLADTRWVAKNAQTERWFADNGASVRAKRSAYFAEWMKMPEHERPALHAADGR